MKKTKDSTILKRVEKRLQKLGDDPMAWDSEDCWDACGDVLDMVQSHQAGKSNPWICEGQLSIHVPGDPQKATS